MPIYDVRCLTCGRESSDILCAVAAVAACLHCGAPTERVWRSRGTGVIADECDFVQENGTRHPIRFRSKIAFQRWLNAHHYENRVEHRTIPGTDKSPYTSDWSKGSIDPQTLKNAEILAARQGQAKGGGESSVPDVPVSWSIRELA